jgi:hypothetical protein
MTRYDRITDIKGSCSDGVSERVMPFANARVLRGKSGLLANTCLRSCHVLRHHLNCYHQSFIHLRLLERLRNKLFRGDKPVG